MNLQEIKAAIKDGKKVCWSHDGYEVRKDSKLNEFNIICLSNNNCIGLTHMDGVTMNGKEEDFYIFNDTPTPAPSLPLAFPNVEIDDNRLSLATNEKMAYEDDIEVDITFPKNMPKEVQEKARVNIYLALANYKEAVN